MGLSIRQATAADAPEWLSLVRATLGDSYPGKDLYDIKCIRALLDPGNGEETWVAESSGRLSGSVSFLKPWGPDGNPVANLGRNLLRPESVADNSAAALLHAVNEIATKRGEMSIVRLAADDNAQQVLFEKMGYVCVGFQPSKHMLQQRVGILFYVRGANSVLVTRHPLSESLPQVSELATAALENLQIPVHMTVRDGACGYPLTSDFKIHDATPEDFERWHSKLGNINPPIEVSGHFNCGFGMMRLPADRKPRAFLGIRGERISSGMSCYFDEQDRCDRIIDAFSCDDISMGALLAHVVKTMQTQTNAVYTEVDILATAPRLLKSAEQLGFVPVAYLPAFYCRNGQYADVVKMVKLHVSYSLEPGGFTSHARSIVQIIDRNFEDQKMGLAIINLLRPLSMFGNLGDGELRKMARLFVQKLYRPGEQVFARGESGDEAFVVLRGKINIQMDLNAPPIAQISDGKIMGELAFLDGSPRTAFAIAAVPTILLVMKRDAFTELVRREPTLGMMVMRNLAQDLAAKLRTVNESLAAGKKT